MKPKREFEVFISHAAADRTLAVALRDLICGALNLGEDKIFVSSDNRSLRPGMKDEPQITEAHKNAKTVVALMTPRSIFRPWVIYETGGANFHSAKPLFVVLSNGATVDCLPAPLKVWHAGSLSDRTCLQNLCECLRGVLGKRNIVLAQKKVRRVIRLATRATGDWEAVNVTLVAEKAANSPFGIQSILDDTTAEGAKRDIYLFGQNLHFLTRGQTRYNIKQMVFNWLQKDTARQFTAVLCDIRCAHEVATLENMFVNEFKRHLRTSSQELKRWIGEARRLKLNLNVLVTDFVPTTAVFVDPERASGYMVLTPITYKAIPTERPHFIVGRKQNSAVFGYYWYAYFDRIRTNSSALV